MEEVLATETEYDDLHVQPSPDHSKKVITSHIDYQSKPKTNFKEIKKEKLSHILEEYRSQGHGTDVLKYILLYIVTVKNSKIWFLDYIKDAYAEKCNLFQLLNNCQHEDFRITHGEYKDSFIIVP